MANKYVKIFQIYRQENSNLKHQAAVFSFLAIFSSKILTGSNSSVLHEDVEIEKKPFLPQQMYYEVVRC